VPVGEPAAVKAATFDLEENSREAESVPRPPPVADGAPSAKAPARLLGLYMGTLCCLCFPFLFGPLMLCFI